MKKIILFFSGIAFAVGAVSAQAGQSSDEIARELANPNTALTSLKIQNQYYSFDGDLPGADDLDMFLIYVQPTLPFPFDNGYTLWVRPGLPYIVEQPVYDSEGRRLEDKSGLGDITLDIQYGTTLENGFLWSIGFSSAFPTASPEELGSGSLTLGPGFQLGRVSSKLVLGMFSNHQWDISGDADASPDRPYLRRSSESDGNIGVTTIQLFAVATPGGGWTYGTKPIMTYDHESEQWAIPAHFTVGKTVVIHGRPWNFSLDLNYFVERADAVAAEWMIGFNVAPVVENVFARWLK